MGGLILRFITAISAFMSVLLFVLPIYAGDTVMPEFSASDIQGTIYNAGSFQGKELVLFFFTFECPHCRRAMPFIKDIYRQGHQVLGVVYSTRPKELDKKRKKAGLTFPIMIGTKEFQKAFNIRGVPTMILIAPDGTKAGRFTGSKGAKRLQESLWEKN